MVAAAQPALLGVDSLGGGIVFSAIEGYETAHRNCRGEFPGCGWYQESEKAVNRSLFACASPPLFGRARTPNPPGVGFVAFLPHVSQTQ